MAVCARPSNIARRRIGSWYPFHREVCPELAAEHHPGDVGSHSAVGVSLQTHASPTIPRQNDRKRSKTTDGIATRFEDLLPKVVGASGFEPRNDGIRESAHRGPIRRLQLNQEHHGYGEKR